MMAYRAIAQFDARFRARETAGQQGHRREKWGTNRGGSRRVAAKHTLPALHQDTAAGSVKVWTAQEQTWKSSCALTHTLPNLRLPKSSDQHQRPPWPTRKRRFRLLL